MKKLIALFVGVVFVAGVCGVALAQTTTAPKDDMKKTEKPAGETMKKPAMHSASGTVKSAAADSVVVAGKSKGKETEWTFAVDPKTKIRKGRKDISAGDLATGDSVSVRYHDDAGKMVADRMTVRPAKKPAAAAARPAEKKDETKK